MWRWHGARVCYNAGQEMNAASLIPGHPFETPKCFLHIPKCAGMSIHAALQAALPVGSLAPRRFDRSVFADFHDFELLPEEARNLIAVDRRETQALGKFRVVSGHFSLPTLLQITDPLSISTVLREPRTRLLSLYAYWRVPGIHDLWSPYRTADHAQRPLGEFLSQPRIASVIDNQICRMLLYGDERLPESSFTAESDIESIAADAVAQLDALGFVGVLEQGDIWQGLARLFNVKLIPTKLNITEELERPTAAERKKRPTSETLDLIQERNAADLLVYNHVLARAGLDTSERQRLGDETFAYQLATRCR